MIIYTTSSILLHRRLRQNRCDLITMNEVNTDNICHYICPTEPGELDGPNVVPPMYSIERCEWNVDALKLFIIIRLLIECFVRITRRPEIERDVGPDKELLLNII